MKLPLVRKGTNLEIAVLSETDQTHGTDIESQIWKLGKTCTTEIKGEVRNIEGNGEKGEIR